MSDNNDNKNTNYNNNNNNNNHIIKKSLVNLAGFVRIFVGLSGPKNSIDWRLVRARAGQHVAGGCGPSAAR